VLSATGVACGVLCWQEEEVISAHWLTPAEALERITFDEEKQALADLVRRLIFE
jgi:hypothetical protein